MPKPRPYERKDDFISRCIGVLINEGKPQDQAAAICNSMWTENKMSAYEKTIKQYVPKK
jgi:hypothetical protein